MAYATYTHVRTLTNLSTSDVGDTDLTSLIAFATAQVNQDINIKVIREKVEYIDQTRENLIDGSNKTYYIKNWKDGYLGDMNNDGSVTTSDIIVYQITSDGTETTLTVSSVVANDGKFVLSSAPSEVTLYVTYVYAPVSVSDPHALVNLACIYLTAALAYSKVNIGKATSIAFGSSRITRHMESFTEYMRKYREVIYQINNKMLSTAEVEQI